MTRTVEWSWQLAAFVRPVENIAVDRVATLGLT